MIIKKIDISSIFPIIINIIKLILEVVSKFIKFVFSIPNIGELVVFVIAKIDNLKDSSKSILSTISIPERIKRLIKKDINIKNEILIFSSVIFFSELKIFLLIILFGLINFMISEDAVFNRIYILVNLIPEVLDIKEPPIEAIKIKYKLKMFEHH